VLANAAALIAEGEVLQLATTHDTSTTEDGYLRVIAAKTAPLFAAAAEVGGIIAGRPRDEQAALDSYGRNLGVAFQLVDDALDYSGKQALMGKTVGDDFREGKITLPVVLAYRRGDAEERAFWKLTLVDGEQIARRPGSGAQAHGPPLGHRGHGGARPPLRPHRPRRPGHLPRLPPPLGAARGRRVLRDEGALMI
jgi:geranylgeranyl pyrophosphate synthase